MRSLLRFGATIIAAGLLAVSFAQSQSKTDLYIDAGHQAKAEIALATIGDGAAMLPREKGSPVLRIRVSNGLQGKAREKLASLGIAVLHETYLPRGKDGLQSRSGIISFMEEGRKQGRKKFPGYLEALKHHLLMRAYPYNEIDFEFIRQQAEHARAMPPRVMNYRGAKAPGSWTFLGPKDLDIPYTTYFGQRPLGGRTNALAFDPNTSSTIYAGGANGGLWKSTNSGVNWQPLSNTWNFQTINCIAMLSSQEIWVGMGDLHGNLNYGSGIMRSLDGGVTWDQIGVATFGANIGVTRLEVVPGTGGNTVIATLGGGTTDFGDIYRTTNRGTTWTRVLNTSNKAWSGTSVGAPDGVGVRAIYAIGAYFPTPEAFRLYRSMDQGATWTAITVPGLNVADFRWSYSVAASKISPGTVYVMAPTERLVLKSDDFGATWTDITAGMPVASSFDAQYNWSQAYYNYNLETSTVPAVGGGLVDVLYASNIDLSAWSPRFGAGAASWRSIGGPTWDGANTVLHNDQHSFAVDPNNPHNMLIGCDGGVFGLTYNSGANTYAVTSKNHEIGTHMFYHIASHPTDLNVVMGGTQDNATPHSRGNLNSWDNVGGGDGAYTAINPTNPNIQYTASQNQFIYRTRNAWTNVSYPSPNWGNIGQTAPFIAVLELSRANPNLLFAATNYLNLYTEGSPNGVWTYALGAKNFGSISAVGTSEANVDVLYVGTTSGDLWRSGDGGANWTQIDVAPVPDRPIREINPSATDANSVVIVLGGASAGRIYECTNTTAGAPVWTHRGGAGGTALPDVPTNTILRDPADPVNRWWVGNDLGVYSTIDRGATWTNATLPLGMPSVIVNKLVLAGGGQYMVAGTYGRGMYRLKLDANPIASLTLSPTSVVGGQTSTGTVTLAAAAPPGGQTIGLTYTAPGSGPASVNVPSGATSANFTVATTTVDADAAVTVTAFNGTATTAAQLNVIRAGVTDITVSPDPVPNGVDATGTVTLNGTVTSNRTVSLTYTPSGSFAVAPATVTVLAGQSTANFTFKSNSVVVGFAATITASLNGLSDVVNFNVSSPNLQGTQIYPMNAFAGQKVFGVVRLSAARPSDATVTVTSSHTSLIPNQSVFIPAGQTYGVFTATAGNPSGTQWVTLTSTDGIETRQEASQIRPASNLLASGLNSNYEVGDGITRHREFMSVVQKGDGVLQAVYSKDTLVVLKSDGTVWTVGKGEFGQHGDGTSGPAATKSILTQIPGLSNIKEIASNSEMAILALNSAGQVYGWGQNPAGQAGKSPFGMVTTPTLIAGLTNIVRVGTAGVASFALDANGDIWSWGSNGSGAGARGAGVNTAVPVKLTTVAGPFVELGLGRNFGFAIHANGSLYGWGLNTDGQLGLGDFVNRTTMALVPVSDVRQIGGGVAYSILLRTPPHGVVPSGGNRVVMTTGDNTTGQRGQGAVGGADTNTFAPIINGHGNTNQIGAGNRHAFYVSQGSPRSWGVGSLGERADGTFVANSGTPTVLPSTPTVSGILASVNNSLLITQTPSNGRAEAIISDGTNLRTVNLRTNTITNLTGTVPAGHTVVGGGEVAGNSTRNEVITVNGAGLLHYMEANGNVLGAATSLGVTLGATEVLSAVANMDNAGRMDFVTFDIVSRVITARLYNGTAQTGTRTLYTLTADELLIGVGDFDVDRFQDLLIFNRVSRTFTVRRYNAGGTFLGTAAFVNAPNTPAVPAAIPAVAAGLSPVAAAETMTGYGSNLVFLNTGTNAFETWQFSRLNRVAVGIVGPVIPAGYGFAAFWR